MLPGSPHLSRLSAQSAAAHGKALPRAALLFLPGSAQAPLSSRDTPQRMQALFHLTPPALQPPAR